MVQDNLPLPVLLLKDVGRADPALDDDEQV